jgi:hypothetical protein
MLVQIGVITRRLGDHGADTRKGVACDLHFTLKTSLPRTLVNPHYARLIIIMVNVMFIEYRCLGDSEYSMNAITFKTSRRRYPLKPNGQVHGQTA